jgi:Zn-finger nucleic acid-binding protein
MNCPRCNVPLMIADRQGIEIDFCQQCRGVWLDRGELDKLVERAARFNDRDDDDDRRPPPLPDRRPEYRDDRYRQEHYYKKRKSFWSEIFD